MMFLTLLSLTIFSSCYATIPRPRGVAISMASFYKPGSKFNCLDRSKEVPFEYVNDDYCDCPDGSDEPGTAACPNGKFHCTNAGYKPLNILSSRVNDGICDCCDGSDEWAGNIECVNNCKELGKKMREEADKQRLLQEEGYKQKLAAIEEGKKVKTEKQQQLEQLEKSKVELTAVKTEMEGLKDTSEAPEKEAKEKHEKAWQDVLEKRRAEKEALQAQIAFEDLDQNDDQRVHFMEIQPRSEFDIDSNGEVSEEEAKEHLEGEESVDQDQFTEKVWPNIKGVYKHGGDQAKGEETNDVRKDEVEDPEPAEEKKEEDEEKMPDYDEETKALIAAADEARQKYNDADGKLRDTENQINNLQNYLNTDFGPNDEFSALKGNCYEYTDREYTYKLCGFDRASQRSKSGGSETTLGNWGRWDGPADNKYSAQKYDNGQSCWNGPNRSVKVNFVCGTENKLTNAFEPSRCEYEFDFTSPSSCTEPPPQRNEDQHDEL